MWNANMKRWLSQTSAHVQAIAVRAGAAVSPATLAQPVVNHRALDAVSAKARTAAADSASSQSEGMHAKRL